MGVRQQLLHDEIVIDLSGKFSPLFGAFELLVRLNLQCINEKFLMGSDALPLHGWMDRRVETP